MRRGLSDSERQRLVDVVAQATRDGLSKVSPAELEVGWEKLEHSLSSGRYPSVPIVRGYVTPWYLRGIVFVSMILGVGITADWMRYQREMAPLAPLHFVLEGSSVGSEQSAEQTITAPAHAPAELVFSDRSRVRLAPNAKIAVQGMDSHGARIALGGGELEVSVTRRQGSSWRFDAGPFTVAVKGTAFHLGFSPERGRLALQMHHGVVEVTGPSKDRRLTLRDGESLELFAEQPVAGPTGGAPAAAPVPASAEVTPGLAPAPVRATVHRPRPKSSDVADGATPSWGSLIAQGEFAAVVKDAEVRGFERTFAEASAAELTALADAARYTRRYDLARQALLRVRERFAGTSRSSEAAFFLGRLAETGPSPATALDWYQTYLRESARGPYAAEASGRQLALYAGSNPARARVAAREYLDRYPLGPQAELARSLLPARGE